MDEMIPLREKEPDPGRPLKAKSGFVNLLQTFSSIDENFFDSQTTPRETIINESDEAGPAQREFCQNFLQVNIGKSFKGKKKESMEDLLKKNSEWKNWKFNVEMKVAMIKEEGDEEPEEHSQILDVEISLIHAAILKRDIQLVKLILDIGKDDVDQLLEEAMKVRGHYNPKLNPEPQPLNQVDGWKFTMRYSWIPGANALHLATCWHIESLKYFLDVTQFPIYQGAVVNPNLKNSRTENQFTPLHVAVAIDDDTTAASLLIKKRADVTATDSAGLTALHIAAQCGSQENVMVLLFDGNSDIMALDDNNKTSLHHAKTAKTLEILLNKCQPNELSKIDELSSKVVGDGQPKCLFEHILETHPECIETYLDLMVTCKNGDEDIAEKQYTFEMEFFNHGTEKKENFLDHHKKLIKAGYPENLRHPVMMLFTDLKWEPHKTKYLINFGLFILFLLAYTYHGVHQIDRLQDRDECRRIHSQLWTLSGTTLSSALDPKVSYQWTENEIKNNTLALAVTGKDIFEETIGDQWKKGAEKFDYNQTDPNKPVLDLFTLTKFDSLKVLTVKTGVGLEIQDLGKQIYTFSNNDYQKLCHKKTEKRLIGTEIVALITLTLLTIWEILQFIPKVMRFEIGDYLSLQNMIEALMISLSVAFFAIENSGESTETGIAIQGHLLGWSLFLAWFDFTMFLGRFDLFGKHIYRSFHVMKNVAWSMAVFIPSVIAFALAFHSFMRNSSVWEGPVTSVIRTFGMLMGEFNDGTDVDKWLYDNIKKIGGSNFSVQIMVTMFFIYGTIIIANLITAWIVVNQKHAETEIILAKQRIEEITGSSEIVGFFKSELNEKNKSKNVPARMCVRPELNVDDIGFKKILWKIHKRLMAGLIDNQILNAKVIWKPHIEPNSGENKKEEEIMKKEFPFYVPMEIIELTLETLDKKKANRSSLVEEIESVLEKTKEKVEKLESR